jgi:uncharacterized membrane protein YoaK (UPF0700 family)
MGDALFFTVYLVVAAIIFIVGTVLFAEEIHKDSNASDYIIIISLVWPVALLFFVVGMIVGLLEKTHKWLASVVLKVSNRKK